MQINLFSQEEYLGHKIRINSALTSSVTRCNFSSSPPQRGRNIQLPKQGQIPYIFRVLQLQCGLSWPTSGWWWLPLRLASHSFSHPPTNLTKISVSVINHSHYTLVLCMNANYTTNRSFGVINLSAEIARVNGPPLPRAAATSLFNTISEWIVKKNPFPHFLDWFGGWYKKGEKHYYAKEGQGPTSYSC